MAKFNISQFTNAYDMSCRSNHRSITYPSSTNVQSCDFSQPISYRLFDAKMPNV